MGQIPQLRGCSFLAAGICLLVGEAGPKARAGSPEGGTGPRKMELPFIYMRKIAGGSRGQVWDVCEHTSQDVDCAAGYMSLKFRGRLVWNMNFGAICV